MRTHTAVEELRALKLCPRHRIVFLGWSDAKCAQKASIGTTKRRQSSGRTQRALGVPVAARARAAERARRAARRRQRRRTAMRGAARVRSRPPRRCVLSC
jgi:hypothetical protein